jgi:RNA polymerase sigma-70 factor (ECF subfamily)
MSPRSAPRNDSTSAAALQQGGLAARAASVDAETALVARIRQGDEGAFKALFDDYYLPLCAYIYGYVGSRALAEEIVQDLLGNIWEQRSQWHIRVSLRTYLFGAARNRAYNCNRDREIVERYGERAGYELEIAGMGRGPEPVDEQMDREELRGALERAMRRLPDRQRQAFYLRWRSHLSYAEIAAVMNVTVKTVENTLGQAIKALRQELSGLL